MSFDPALRARMGDAADPTADEWLAIMRANARLIHAYMNRVTLDPEHRRDLVQSATAIAWLNRLRLKTSLSTRDWLLGCCREARSEWQRLNSHASSEPVSDRQTATDDDLLDEPARDRVHDEMWDAVIALPARQRAVVVYRVVCSMSVGATAAALNCKEGTIKAHLHTGLKKLRATLGSSEALGQSI